MKRALSLVAVALMLLILSGSAWAQSRRGPRKEFRVAYRTTFVNIITGNPTTGFFTHRIRGLLNLRNQDPTEDLIITNVEIFDQSSGENVADLERNTCPFNDPGNGTLLPFSLKPLGVGQSEIGLFIGECLRAFPPVLPKPSITTPPLDERGGFLTVITVEARKEEFIGGVSVNQRTVVDNGTGAIVAQGRNSEPRIILP
ncbi:MAG: hypothetical protein ACE5JS_00170 [Nitrospinota bacterium]